MPDEGSAQATQSSQDASKDQGESISYGQSNDYSNESNIEKSIWRINDKLSYLLIKGDSSISATDLADILSTIDKMHFFLTKYKVDTKEFIDTKTEIIRNQFNVMLVYNIFDATAKKFSEIAGQLLQFKVTSYKKPEWHLFFMQRLQIKPNSEDLIKLHNMKTSWEKIDYILAMNMAKNDGDIRMLISGQANTGKSTLMMKRMFGVRRSLRKYFNIEVPKINLKNDIVYTYQTKTADELIGEKRYLIKAFDEGYLAGMNLESSNPDVIKLIKHVTISRSTNSFTPFCYQNPKRPAKALLERFNIWIHKPSKEYAILYCKPMTFETEDPWHLIPLLKAQSEMRIAYLLEHNPNKVKRLKVKNISQRIFEKYKKLKNAAHEEMSQSNQMKDFTATVDKRLYDLLKAKIDGGFLDNSNLRGYIRKLQPNTPETNISATIKSFWKFYSASKMEEALINETSSTNNQK